MKNMKYHCFPLFDTIDDKVISHGKTTQTKAKVIAEATYVGILAEYTKAVGKGFYEAVGNVGIAAFGGDVVPNLVKVGVRPRGANMTH